MKKSGIWIVIIIILIAIFWYYCDSQAKKYKKEKELAVTEAVTKALDSVKEYHSVEVPPVKTIVIYKEKEVKKEKKAPKPENVFTDKRDSKQYKFIEVEGLLWMAENLNYASKNSWCYDNKPANCDKWGRLYTWAAAKEACPEGWHLPNDEEWNKLIWYYGSSERAGLELQEGGSSDFNVLLAGYRDKRGFYGKADSSAYFWSATEENAQYASFKGFYKNLSNIGEYTYTKPDAFSVRCVKEK